MALRAATATGVPPLTVLDFSSGGVLVQAAKPFEIGAVVHLHLSTPDGALSGTFALRCLHAHRTSGPDDPPAHLSALVFVHPIDERTREILTKRGDADLEVETPSGTRRLRLAERREKRDG